MADYEAPGVYIFHFTTSPGEGKESAIFAAPLLSHLSSEESQPRIHNAHLNKNHVQFVEVRFLFLKALGVRASLDDETYNVLLDAFALVPGQNLPASLDDTLQDL